MIQSLVRPSYFIGFLHSEKDLYGVDRQTILDRNPEEARGLKPGRAQTSIWDDETGTTDSIPEMAYVR